MASTLFSHSFASKLALASRVLGVEAVLADHGGIAAGDALGDHLRELGTRGYGVQVPEQLLAPEPITQAVEQASRIARTVLAPIT